MIPYRLHVFIVLGFAVFSDAGLVVKLGWKDHNRVNEAVECSE